MLWNWHFVDYYECFNGVNEFQTSSPLFKSEEWMFLVHDSTAEIYHNIVFTRFRIYCVVFRICSYSVFIGAKLSLKGKFVWENNFLLLNWCPCFNACASEELMYTFRYSSNFLNFLWAIILASGIFLPTLYITNIGCCNSII